jgi:hypothetical protein
VKKILALLTVSAVIVVVMGSAALAVQHPTGGMTASPTATATASPTATATASPTATATATASPLPRTGGSSLAAPFALAAALALVGSGVATLALLRRGASS